MTDHDAPEGWTAWHTSRGTLAEHLAGTAPWVRHTRELKPAPRPKRARDLFLAADKPLPEWLR